MKIWQDLERFDKGTWQDLVTFDKGDMSRFGKIWQDLTRGDMARFGKIWQIDIVKIWQDVARFGK